MGAIAFLALLSAAQMLIQLPPGLFVLKDMLVNPFMAHRITHLIFHPSADLFRAPLFLNKSLYKGPDAGINPSPGLVSFAGLGQVMGLFVTISTQALVSSKFPADGRLMNANHFGNLCLIMACLQQRINSVPLLLGKLPVVSHRCSSFWLV